MSTTVTLSPKFQVVIPREVRERMHLKAGQKMQVLTYGHHIALLPVESAKSLRGFLKGPVPAVEREESDRV